MEGATWRSQETGVRDLRQEAKPMARPACSSELDLQMRDRDTSLKQSFEAVGGRSSTVSQGDLVAHGRVLT